MSYITTDFEKNIIQIFPNNSKKPNSLKRTNLNKLADALHDNNELVGIEVKDLYLKEEKKGLKAENCFKQKLEDNKIPYLYIGQNPIGLHKSEVLLKDMKSKRPDFFVQIPNLGGVFFDVKCRKKIGFVKEGKKFFQLTIGEIDALKRLQDYLMTPVWIAFADEYDVYKKSTFDFNIVSISNIYDFLSKIKEHINKEIYNNISCLRIPNRLMSKVDKEFKFQIGFSKLQEELISEYAELNKGLVNRLQDDIKNYIRNNEVYKSKLDSELNINIKYAFRFEIRKVLESLIESNIVIWNKYEYLTLVGE
jgi:hypothetical protein